jgi:hypothetical protein
MLPPALRKGPWNLPTHLDLNTGPTFFLSDLDIWCRTAVTFFDDDLLTVAPLPTHRYICIRGSLGALFVTQRADAILVANALGTCGQRKDRRSRDGGYED